MFMDFINTRAHNHSSSHWHFILQTDQLKDTNRRSKVPLHTAQSNPSWTAPSSCTACGDERHPLYHCATLKAMANEALQARVRSNNLCFNCLSSGHRTKDAAVLTGADVVARSTTPAFTKSKHRWPLEISTCSRADFSIRSSSHSHYCNT